MKNAITASVMAYPFSAATQPPCEGINTHRASQAREAHVRRYSSLAFSHRVCGFPPPQPKADQPPAENYLADPPIALSMRRRPRLTASVAFSLSIVHSTMPYSRDAVKGFVQIP